jgi:hypothetical protein
MLTVLGLGLFALACNKPGEDVQRKQESQQEQLTQAQMEGKSVTDKKMDEANQKLDKSMANFDRTRDDYRNSREKDLADIDKRINDLEAKDKMATGKKKADLDAQLMTIRQDRDAFAAKLRQVDTANATSFDGLKSDIDTSYDELKSAVHAAE